MGEFVASFDIPHDDLVTAGPAGVVEAVINLPPSYDRWTVLTNPEDSGAGDDPTFELQYDIGNNQFLPINPASSGTALSNTANTITREDVVTRLKLIFTLGATIPSGDIVNSLFIMRSN